MNAENALLQYEAGQTAYPMSELDSGDATLFESDASLFSRKSGHAPDVRPNGLINGGAIRPAASGTNNLVDVAALLCYLAGTKITVPADTDVTVSRGETTDTHRITSITVDSAGDIVAVPGVDGTSFTETRGGDGGPAYIPVGSIEIGQVRTTSVTAAPILASEIFQVIGIHQEYYWSPVPEVDYFNGTVKFPTALPLIHTGDKPKKIYASYSEPLFSDVDLASDFVPAETSHSVSSQQVYGKTIGSSSSTLGQAQFTAYLNDGVGDALLSGKNEMLFFKFFPDRYKTPHLLQQGRLGINRTFPAGDNIQAACTVSAESPTIEVNV